MYEISTFIFTLSLSLSLLVGCDIQVTDSQQEVDTHLSGVYSSYIFDENYAFKSTTLHLTQYGNLIDGLGDYDGMHFDITKGNVVGNVIAFDFSIINTNYGEIKGTFRGNLVGEEIHGHWNVDIEGFVYALHFKKDPNIKWLPKYSHNQGGLTGR